MILDTVAFRRVTLLLVYVSHHNGSPFTHSMLWLCDYLCCRLDAGTTMTPHSVFVPFTQSCEAASSRNNPYLNRHTKHCVHAVHTVSRIPCHTHTLSSYLSTCVLSFFHWSSFHCAIKMTLVYCTLHCCMYNIQTNTAYTQNITASTTMLA